MTLKARIQSDISRVFMNVNEYADAITLQCGTEIYNIVGSLQQNAVSNNSGAGGALEAFSWTLYTPCPIGNKAISTGAHVLINGAPYSVEDIAEELGVVAIKLTRGGTR